MALPVPGFNEPFPYNDVIVKPNGKAADVLADWVDFSLQPRIQASPLVSGSMERITDGNAAVSTTPIGGQQTAGLYRISYAAENLVPDAGGNSLQLTITWTHNTKVLTRTYAPMTGVTTTTTQGIVDAIEIDGGTVVSYDLAYTSFTAGVFHYQIALALELIQTVS